jgi:hypothetical protein
MGKPQFPVRSFHSGQSRTRLFRQYPTVSRRIHPQVVYEWPEHRADGLPRRPCTSWRNIWQLRARNSRARHPAFRLESCFSPVLSVAGTLKSQPGRLDFNPDEGPFANTGMTRHFASFSNSSQSQPHRPKLLDAIAPLKRISRFTRVGLAFARFQSARNQKEFP